MEREGITIVDVMEGDGLQILFTQQGIWMPKKRSSPMRNVPDLTRIMLDSKITKRNSKVDDYKSVDMREIVYQNDEPFNLDRKLRQFASNVPYTSVTRCYLRRAGRFKRPKLAFEYFDERSLSIVTCEFIVTSEGVDELEEILGELISDRLEVH